MRLSSTGGRAPSVSFGEALLAGIAPDGGLYLPDAVPPIDAGDLASWRGRPFQDVACRLAERWLSDEFAAPVLGRLVSEALDFPVPTVEVDRGLRVLELFHGPTLAFKDFGARFLARFFGHLLARRGDHATILVATSGDTGSAVARGFAGVDAVRVVVLYPAGKVSAFQESQMATVGGNVTAVRVPGTFDDCQRLVKAAFPDPALTRLHLSSANSINIGRLLPQSFYYVFSYLSVAARPGDAVVFSVPSGNLGNLTAGVLARRMGLPAGRFVAATNVNDVLPEYLTTGAYRARPSIPTLSNAMDVGDPNNFARLVTLCGMGVEAMRAIVRGERVTETETRQEIRETYAGAGYVLDPHGAVACAAARRWQGDTAPGAPVVALATAHPAKFADAIAAELGFAPALPEHERGWRTKPLLAVGLPDSTSETFRDFLLALQP
jgi:threonine synthase